jgi:hypothetical protein
VIRQIVREPREEYKRCVEGGRRPQICCVLTANTLLPSVTHDDEYRFYVLKGADRELPVYDVE